MSNRFEADEDAFVNTERTHPASFWRKRLRKILAQDQTDS